MGQIESPPTSQKVRGAFAWWAWRQRFKPGAGLARGGGDKVVGVCARAEAREFTHDWPDIDSGRDADARARA